MNSWGIHMTRTLQLQTKGTVAVVTVIFLLLSGCAAQPHATQSGAAQSASPTPSAAPTDPPASPTPTTAPNGPNPSDPSSWLIASTEVGPLALGDRLSDDIASMSAFTSTVQDACPWVTAFDKADLPSIWIPDPLNTGVIEQIVVQRWGSAAAVSSTSPQTSAGIGIGATLEQLTAAYPDLTQTEGKYASYYSSPDGSGHWINFALSDDGLVDTIVVRDSSVMDSEYCG